MKKRITLQPSEWIIMEKLWEDSPKTIMQIVSRTKGKTRLEQEYSKHSAWKNGKKTNSLL